MEKDKEFSQIKKAKRSISNTDKFIAAFIIISIFISLGVSIYASTIHDQKRLSETMKRNIEVTFGEELAGNLSIIPSGDSSNLDTIAICEDLRISNLKLTETIDVFDRAKYLMEETRSIVFSGEADSADGTAILNIVGIAFTESGEIPVLMQARVSGKPDEKRFESIWLDDEVKNEHLQGCKKYEIRDIQAVPWPSRLGDCPLSPGISLVQDPDLLLGDMVGRSPDYTVSNDMTALPVAGDSRLRSETLASDNKTMLLEYEARVSPEGIVAEYDIEMFRRWWMRDLSSATGGMRLYRNGNEAVSLEILSDGKSGQGLTRYRVTAVSQGAVSKRDEDLLADNTATENQLQDSGHKSDGSDIYFLADAVNKTKIKMPEGTVLRGYSSENRLVQRFDFEVPGGLDDPDKVVSCDGEYSRIVSEEEAKGHKFYKCRFAGGPSLKCNNPAAVELQVYDKPVLNTENRRCIVTLYAYPREDTEPETPDNKSTETVLKDFGTFKLTDGSRVTELFLVNDALEKKVSGGGSGDTVSRLEGSLKPATTFPATLNIRAALEYENESGVKRVESRWFHCDIKTDASNFEELHKENFKFEFALPDRILDIKIEEVQLISWPLEGLYGRLQHKEDEDCRPSETVDDLEQGIASILQAELPGEAINNKKSADGNSLDYVYEADYSCDSLLAYFDCAAFNQGWYRDNKLLKGEKRRYIKAGYELAVDILPDKIVSFEGIPGSYKRTRYRLSIHPETTL